ncbi:MAG: MOSC domain-containing protein [Bacteroidota bacterium]|nr:MOSC domain-containing protein [Bacteroidota bacterium]
MIGFDFKQLINNFSQKGQVLWIGVRPGKHMPIKSVIAVNVLENKIEGDHYNGNILSKRHVTLIQQEHIDVVASLMAKEVSPEQLRRNIVVKGLNLLALKDKKFQIGEAIFEMTGLCHPCSKMEKNLGVGGYNAMRGHGGITARIIKGGLIRLGDAVTPIS